MFDQDVFVPGLRIKLMALSAIKSKLTAVLIGVRRSRYLIIEHPTFQGVPAQMEEGTQWSVNFINKGSIIDFKTEVMGACRRPVHLTFLSFPEDIERTSLRQGIRYPVNIQTILTETTTIDDTPTGTAKGIVRDISTGGCSVITTNSFAVDTTILMTLSLPNQEPLEGLVADVKSSRELGGNRYILGLSFTTGLSTDSYKDLLLFLDSIKAMPLRF